MNELLALDDRYEDSLIEARAAVAEAELKAAGVVVDRTKSEEESNYTDSMWQIYNNLGVIEIKGMLVNSSSKYNSYMGLVSYDEIRQATLSSLEAGAKGVLFVYDSPGGVASGMEALAEFVSSLTVPTVSYASGTMASAAYMTGMQSDLVYTGNFSSVGSIGVYLSYVGIAGLAKKEGVKPERFRSGKLKGTPNRLFDLSAEERSYIQKMVDDSAELFYNAVAGARGIPRAMLDTLGITDGGGYLGADALRLGLVDGIVTFDKAVAISLDLVEKSLDTNTKKIY